MPHRTLNRITKDYNATRPWLDKELSKMHLMRGFHVGYSMGDEHIRMSLMKLTWYRSQTTASGIPPGQSTMVYRDLRLRNLDIDLFELAGFVERKSNKKQMIGAGMGFNVAYTKLKTRTYSQDIRDDKAVLKDLDYQTIFSNSSDFMNISTNFGFSPRIYFVPGYSDKARIEFGIGPNLYFWNEIMPMAAKQLESTVNYHYPNFKMNPGNLMFSITATFY